ncbi:MAG: hypothetical protein N3G19_00940 [Candidatus Pacearchaeota archaeon]|nr:hypothetical protein [Candidatus Pacearchaeota archaeon]
MGNMASISVAYSDTFPYDPILSVIFTFLPKFFTVFFKLENTNIEALSLCFLFWIFLAINLSKIASEFTAFSKVASWIVGFGITSILAFSGAIAQIILFLLSTFKFIITLVIILIFFTGTYILEMLIDIKLKKEKKFKEMLEQEKGKAMLKEFAKTVK